MKHFAGDSFVLRTNLPVTFTIYDGDDVVYSERFPDGKIQFMVDLPAGKYHYIARGELAGGRIHQAGGPFEVIAESRS